MITKVIVVYGKRKDTGKLELLAAVDELTDDDDLDIINEAYQDRPDFEEVYLGEVEVNENFFSLIQRGDN